MGTSSTGNFPLQRAAGRCKAVRAPGVKSSRSCRPKGVCAWVGPDGVFSPVSRGTGSHAGARGRPLGRQEEWYRRELFATAFVS